MSNILSCNMYSYGGRGNADLSHLSALGVRCVEIGVPAVAEAEACRANLANFGITASSVQAPCPIGDADIAEQFKPYFESAQIMGSKVVFVSVHAGEIPLPTVYDHLRALGDLAVAAGVRLAMETHPDLCNNGDKMVATMKAIDHPGVRVNFDTANIYYYNHGVTALSEVVKAAQYVASVHLKDSMGEYETWNFPTLGQGIVEFPSIFATLASVGFHGPYTMELEGHAGWNPTAEMKAQAVADSVAYLRSARLIDAWPE